MGEDIFEQPTLTEERSHEEAIADQRAAYANVTDVKRAVDELNAEERRHRLDTRDLADTITEFSELAKEDMVKRAVPRMNSFRRTWYRVMEFCGADVYNMAAQHFLRELDTAERSLDGKIRVYDQKLNGGRRQPGLNPTIADKERMISAWAELFKKIDSQKEGLGVELARLQEDMEGYRTQIGEDPRNMELQHMHDAASQNLRTTKEDMFNLDVEQKRVSSKIKTYHATIQSMKRVKALYEMARARGERELDRLRSEKAIVEVYIAERGRGVDLATFFRDLAGIQDLVRDTGEISRDMEDHIADTLEHMNEADRVERDRQMDSYGHNSPRIEDIANQGQRSDRKEIAAIVDQYTAA